MDALIFAQPQPGATVIPCGKVVDGMWKRWKRRTRNGQAQIGFENTMVPFTPGRNVHDVYWRLKEGRWSAELESVQIALDFDQAMLFLQVAEADQWNAVGRRRWLMSEVAADVDPVRPPPRLLTPKPTRPYRDSRWVSGHVHDCENTKAV